MFKERYIVIGIVVLLLTTLAALSYPSDDQVELVVKNPAFFNVSALVKCDFDYTSQQYSLLASYKIPAHKTVMIKISNRYKRCEIYPRFD
jgi:hypothetical protein